MPAFSSKQFLPEALIARITETRVADPDFVLRAAAGRRCRESLTIDGRLNILAADHPARLVTKVGADPLAMTDRGDYLARIIRILTSDNVDGVMATMDILEDLLLIHAFVAEAGGPALLDNKLLIASLNRGGLAGSAWELDDPITGPRPATCQEWGFDGMKVLLRIADDDAASLKTILASVQAINEANAVALPLFLEPLPVTRTEKGWTVTKSASALARIAGVASALGDSSRYVWLKLPYCEGFDRVARSTTLPILLLGGESAGGIEPFLNEISSALRAGSNVRGALVGRNVLYPGDEDPFAAAEAVGGVIHQGQTVEQAMASLAANRGRDMDVLSHAAAPR